MHVMDYSCASILQFSFEARVSATAQRQILNRIFGQFFLLFSGRIA